MDYARLTSVFASTSRALRPFFEIDPEDRNPLHVGVPADVRPSLHGEPARRRSRIEARAGRAAGEEVPPGAHRAAGRDRRDVEGVPADRGVHQDGPVSGRAIRRASQPRRHAQEARARARREACAPGRSDSESRARAEGAGWRRRSAEADRSAGAVPEFGLRRRRVVQHVGARPHVLRCTPGVPRDLPLYRGGNLGTPGDPAPRGFPLVLAKDRRRISRTDPAGSNLARRSSRTPRR